MQVNISHSLLCDPCTGKPPFCNPVGPTKNLYYQSINMRALLYAPRLKASLHGKRLLGLGNASLHTKGLSPVRHAALLPSSISFQVAAKLSKPAKSHYRHLQILYQLRVQNLPLNPVPSLALSMLGSQAQAGNLPSLPGCYAGPCHRFGSNTGLNYCFPRQQVQTRGCSQGPIEHDPSAN